VRDLETRLGVRLLERHARGVSLTTAGETFHPNAVEVLSALEKAQGSVAPFALAAGETIRLGVTPTLGRVLLEDLIDQERHPGAAFELREALTSELIRLLRGGEIDAAFCYDAPQDPSYQTTPLFEEDLVLVGRPGLPFEKSLPLADLARFPMALGPRHDATRQAIERATSEAGVRLDVRAEIAPISLKREMLIRRGLCSIVPFGLFLPEIEAGLLHAALIRPPIRRTMVLASRRDLASDARAVLTDLARKAIELRVSQGQLGWRLMT